MNHANLNKLISEALAIESENAADIDGLGFMARILVIATMPHRRQRGTIFKRENGLFKLYMYGNPKIGLPYGSYPRLLLSWLTTEAVRTNDRHLELGPTLSSFMAELGLVPTGGRWGNIFRLRDQVNRLFHCTVSCHYNDDETDQGQQFTLVRRYQTWWDTAAPDQIMLWRSWVELSRDFFDELISAPVPIDMRALKALKRSPMALDIYNWLTYRMSYLKKPAVIPWRVLQLQFGADYGNTRQGKYDFKRAFIKHLKSVVVIYPEAKAKPLDTGLELKPSKPHVPISEFR